MREASQGLSTSVDDLCTATAPCGLNIPLLSGPIRGQLVLQASNELVLGDRSRVVDATGVPLAIVNTGNASTNIGSGVHIGTVVSQAPVTIRSGAVVSGDVRSAATVTTQTPVTIAGSIQRDAALGTPGKIAWSVTYPGDTSGDVDLEPGQQRTLAPGRYGNLAVKSRANVRLSTGTYFFDSLDLEPQATTTLADQTGTIIIYVRGALIWRGTASFQGAAADVMLGYLGSQDTSLEAPFQGTMVAPSATVSIGATSSTFSGAFFARNVQVRPDVTIQFSAPSFTGPAANAVSASFTAATGGPVPPLPTSFGSTPDEWAAIVTAYVNQLIQSGYIGPTIVAPPPTWAQTSSLTIPSVPRDITAGPGGLLPLAALTTRAAPFSPPDPFAPAPSPNEHAWEPGVQSFGDSAWGGALHVAAHADANRSAGLGFWTHADTNMDLSLTIFGKTVDAFSGFVTVDTATERLQANGSAQPFGQAHVSASVAIAGNIVNKTFDKLGAFEVANLAHGKVSIPLPAVPLPVPPPLTGNITPSAGITYGAPVTVALQANGFTSQFVPQVGADAAVSVNGGIGGFGFGVTAGIKGAVTIANAQLPLTGSLNWAVDRTPPDQTPGGCQAVLDGDLTITAKITVLSGKLQFVVSVSLPWIGSIDLFSQDLATFPGFDILDPTPLQLASFSQNVFKLDPDECKFGGLSCAKVATPNQAVAAAFDFDTGINDPIAGSYGQAACKDQYLVDVDLMQPAFAGKKLAVLGDWSSNLPRTPCDEQAVMTVFGFDGTSWAVFDQIQYVAQSTGGDTCFATAQSHSNSAQAGNPGTLVTPADHLQQLRVAINATEGDTKVPIKVFGVVSSM